jgi:hypothetical protein
VDELAAVVLPIAYWFWLAAVVAEMIIAPTAPPVVEKPTETMPAPE